MPRVKTLGKILTIMGLIASSTSVLASQNDGLLWLDQQRQPSGSYGTSVETAEVLLTLSELGQSGYDVEPVIVPDREWY